MVLDLSPGKWYSIHMNEKLIPRVGDLVKMECDGEYGLTGVVHGVRLIAPQYASHENRGEVYDITWPDIRSVQYLSEIRVISRS